MITASLEGGFASASTSPLGATLPLTAGIPQSAASPMAEEMARPWEEQEAARMQEARKKQRAYLEKLDSALLDPDFFKKHPLPPNPFSDDQEKDKRAFVVHGYLRLKTGQPDLSADAADLYRASIAHKEFGGKGALDADEFHGELVKAAQGRKEEKELQKQLLAAVADDATLPPGTGKGMAGILQAAKTHAGYDAEKIADYAEVLADYSAKMREKIAPFRQQLDEVWNARLNGRNVTPETLAGIPDEHLPEFLNALRLRAETLGDKEKETFLAGTRKDFARSLKGYGENAMNAVVEVGFDLSSTGRPLDEKINYAFERGEWAEAKAGSERARNRGAEVQRIMSGSYDPIDYVKGWGWLQKAPGVTVTSLSMAVPVAGPLTMAASMSGAAQESVYLRMRDGGMNERDAGQVSSALGPLIMLPQMGIEKIGYGAWGRKLPWMNKIIDGIGDRVANRAARLLMKGGVITGIEGTSEVMQGFTEYLVQDFAGFIAPHVPDVDLDKEFAGAWREFPEIAGSMMFLSLFGAAGGLNAEARAQAWAKSTPRQRAALGITPEASARIDEAAAKGPSSLLAAVDEGWASRVPNTPEAAAAAAAEAEATRQELALAEQVKASGMVPDIIRSGEGFAVLDSETKEEVGTAPDMPGAMRIAMAHSAALDDVKSERVAYLATMLEAGDEALAMAGDPNAKNSFELSTVYTEAVAAAEDPASIDQFTRQAAMQEQVNGGDGSTTYAALGRNVAEARGLVRTFTNRLFHGASVTTIVHETVHGMVSRAEAAGAINRADKLQFVKAVNTVMQGKVLTKGRNAGQKLALLPEGIAEADITDDMINEGISHIAEAEILRTRKRAKDDKTLKISPGIISRNLLALSKLVGEKRLGKFRALLDGARGVFGLSSARVLAMQKGFREGRFDMASYEAFLDKLTGRDHQAEHNGMARDEAAALVGEAVESGEMFGIVKGAKSSPLSLAPASMVEGLQLNAAARIKDPRVKAAMFTRMLDKLGALKRDKDELGIAFGKGYKRKAIEDPRKSASIRKERNMREALRREELEDEAHARHGGILDQKELAQLKAQPVHGYLANPDTPLRGRLMSQSAAAARGETFFDPKKQGDYDGAGAASRSLFGGELMPDQAAQELFDAGLINSPTPDAMWDALQREAKSVTKMREFMKAAQEDLRKARLQAKEEANAWENGRLKEEAANYSPRQRLLRALAMLDGILSVLPPEVRGRIGGYTQLAKLGTDEARLKFLNERIAKADAEIEKWLGKEYGKMLDKLIERSDAKREAGKKAKGKLGAEGHRYFEQVKQVRHMSADDITGAMAVLDSKMDEMTDDELANAAERYQILMTYGAFADKSAAEMGRAIEQLREVYETNRNAWRTTEEARITAVRALGTQALKELGNPKDSDVAETRKAAKTLRGKTKDIAWSMLSFREVLEKTFGRDSVLAKRWATATREAFRARTGAIIAAQKRWKTAMEQATGLKGRAARRMLWDMENVADIKASVRPEIHETFKVPIDTFFDAEKKKSLGLTAQESAQLTEQFEALPADSQKEFLTLQRVTRKPADPVEFTTTEAIYLSMMWAQDGYRPGMRLHGMGEEFQAELEAQFSTAAQGMREHLASEYAGNYEPLRALFARMFGVDLKQTENYTPGKFFSQGDESPMNVDGGGIVEGGFKQGFLKDRKRHLAKPRAESAFKIYFNHLNQTEHWKALAEISREIHGVLGRPEVKEALMARSPEAANALQKWMQAIDGNGFNNPKSSWLMETVISSQAYLALAWKASTIAKNFLGAGLNAAYRMPTKDFLRGYSRLMAGKIDFRHVFDSDLIQNRLAGGFAPEVRAAISEGFGAKPTLRGDALLKGMEVIGTADAYGTAMGAAVVYDHHYRAAIRHGLTPQAAEALAMNETADVISRTAQPSEVTDRSLMELQLHGIGKLGFIFASEARQKSAMWLNAWGHTLTGKATADDVRVLLISHLVMAPIMHAISVMIRDARDPDDDEWFDDKYWNLKDFAMAAGTGPLSGLPLIRDVFDGFNGDSGPLKRMVDSGRALKKLFMDEPKGDKMDWYEAQIVKVLQGLNPTTAVGASVFDQLYDFTRNATDSTPDDEP